MREFFETYLEEQTAYDSSFFRTPFEVFYLKKINEIKRNFANLNEEDLKIIEQLANKGYFQKLLLT